jgi:hypothetical protein
MAYNVAGLEAYVKKEADSLVTASIFDAKTQQMIYSKGNVVTGIKTAQDLNIMDTDAVFQAGGTCGWNASGTTTLTSRRITVGQIKVQEALCPKSLNASHMQHALKAGSRQEEVPFEKEFSERKAQKIAKQLEVALWQGDLASGNVNLNKFDGFIKLVETAGTFINANLALYTTGAPITSATSITEANVRNVIKGVVKAIPEDLQGKEDLVFFCGYDVFTTYVAALIDANLFHYTAKEGTVESGEITIPGTNYKLIAVHGLNTLRRIVGMRTSNMYLGTDMTGEEDKFDIFYAKEAAEVRFDAEWKLGVQVAFPGEVIYFKLT